ncbi:MAG: TrkA family potassium uptake protein, partial [Fusobacteriaceae bacterium]|nr:TrkA family potassium uptake protein [Fusobacteriaceae bacterium]
RTMDYNNESKFHKAGADYIISPNKITANRITNIISKKNIFEYLDILSKNDIDNYGIEFVNVPNNSSLINKELREAKIPQSTGLNVIGIEKNGQIQMNPLSNTIIERNSKLLVFGNSSQISQLESLLNDEKHVNC